MSTRRRLLVAVGAALAAASALAVSTFATLDEARSDPPCPDDAYGCAEFLPGEPLLLGALLSGSSADGDADLRRAMELALEARGGTLLGRPIRLLVEDDGCTPRGAARGARILASDPPVEPPVLAVVGAACPPTTQPAAQILSDSGITLVSWSDVPVAFTDPPRSFLVRMDLERGDDHRFRASFRERFGRPPSDGAAVAFRAAEAVLDAAQEVGVTTSDGRVLVPRTPLHRAIRDGIG